jgi:phosphatidylserine/phosphatidylglycerophosphate/cardiolipin synthase-like enzyme
VQYLTEEAIRRRIITMLDQSGPGDDVRIAIFYLSDRAVVRAIKDAAAGGANVRVIIDPNRDAFGRKKNGVPNRPVAAELTAFAADRAAKLKVRWADTHGEQFHTKALCISNPGTGKCQLLCGSANWTRRNLQNLNLEANLYLTGHPEPVNTFAAYFDKAWANQGKLRYTTDYDTYAETGFSLFRKKLLYRFQEASGLSTF